MTRSLPVLLAAAALAVAIPARAEEAADKADFMHVLAHFGLHDLEDERVNAYGQISLMGSGKAPFAAKYTNLHGTPDSLLPTAEGSWTGTATLFLGGKLWPGAEVYVVPEVISERPLSHLTGLGSVIQNAELQKTGGAAPIVYMSRVFLRQTFGFGGDKVEKKSDMMQLGTKVDSRRLVLTFGKLSLVDVLDKNSFAGDIRRQFMNMAFMTHAAWDFAADARGYTWAAIAELYLDSFALRAAHAVGPQDPNQLAIDWRFWEHFGDQVEIEHTHTILGQRGAIRVLGYRNRENMGRFADAIADHAARPDHNQSTCTGFSYVTPGSGNASAPDLCWVRRDNVKMGAGINVEQAIGDDLGVFFRGMYSDGQTEVYAFTSTDRSLSFGAIAKGTLWRRPTDTVGAAFGAGWISSNHAAYLNQGGVDGFIGDGKISRAAESVVEVFYSLNMVRSLWLTADYQHITHPAYNADRGPVDIFGGRLHAEF